MTYGFNINYAYLQLNNHFYSESVPLNFKSPSYKLFNHSLAKELSLSQTLHSQNGLNFLLNPKTHGLKSPVALAYSGHQFANYTLLGDGRAHLLFEHALKNDLYDIQLKGSGPTIYSRGFDGRLTLRSALLEYLMSEALHHLNIPTTRSLAVIKTNDHVKRATLEDGALLLRVAKSHLRFGTFEYAYNHPDKTLLKQLVNYAINRHDKDLLNTEENYIKWFKRVIKRQALLIAKWQSIGFVHGVMNTDNALISGETIDYGPCAFIDTYNLQSVYSSVDTLSRYAYGQQPYIGSWNLATLGKGLVSLINENTNQPINAIQNALSEYGTIFEQHYYQLMAKKIGIEHPNDSDISLIDELLHMMAHYKQDYTNTFMHLTLQQYKDTPFYQSRAFAKWYEEWNARLKKENNPYNRMQENNPFVIPRNHIVKKALDQAAYQDDFKAFNTLLKLVKNPYNQHKAPKYQTPPSNDEEVTTYCGT